MSGAQPERACALCGTACRLPFQAPPAETAPDLDMRPGEPTRSTLPRWLQTCRGCGACAPDLVALPAAARAVVESAAYKAEAGPARAFQRWAMIAAATGEPEAAGQAFLEAAWLLDDEGRDATALRRLAIQAWAAAASEPPTMQDALRLVDVLRRAQEFGAAAARAAGLLARAGLDETDAAILRYQQDRIAAQDAGRHLLSSALRPPAQRPHVSQNKPVKSGFWQRLTGR